MGMGSREEVEIEEIYVTKRFKQNGLVVSRWDFRYNYAAMNPFLWLVGRICKGCSLRRWLSAKMMGESGGKSLESTERLKGIFILIYLILRRFEL